MSIKKKILYCEGGEALNRLPWEVVGTPSPEGFKARLQDGALGLPAASSQLLGCWLHGEVLDTAQSRASRTQDRLEPGAPRYLETSLTLLPSSPFQLLLHLVDSEREAGMI